jgi:hypothetical protein
MDYFSNELLSVTAYLCSAATDQEGVVARNQARTTSGTCHAHQNAHQSYARPFLDTLLFSNTLTLRLGHLFPPLPLCRYLGKEGANITFDAKS